MNKIFKVVWSKTKECYVVVSEVAKNNSGKKKVLASVLAALAVVGAGATQVDAASFGAGGGNAAADASISIGGGYSGPKTAANDKFAIAIGDNASATGKSSISMGYKAETNGQVSIAIGEESKVKKSEGTAVGPGAVVEERFGAAFGHEAKATKQYATAIGSGAQGEGEDSQAIGREAQTTGYRAVAVGTLAKALNNSAIAIGQYTKADGTNSIAMGKSSKAHSFDAIAIGHNNNSRTYSAISIGTDNTSDVAYGLTDAQFDALPYDENNLTNPSKTDPRRGVSSTIAIGRNNVAGNVEAIAIGTETKATKTDAIAIGARAEATGDYALAIGGAAGGYKVTADEYGTAVGVRSNAANRGAAFGAGSNAGSQKSVAIGYSAKASAQKATSNYEFSGSHGTPSPAGYNTETITINSGSAPSTGAVAGNYYDAGSGVAIGNGATVSDESDRAVVVGPDAKTNGNAHYSVVLGSGSHADASDGFVAGHGSYVESRESIAMGSAAHVSGNENIRSQAIGYGATVSGTGAYDATAIGATAQVSGVQGGVALGSGSLLSRTTNSNENVGFNSKFVDGTKVRNRAYTAKVNALGDEWDAGAQIGAVSVGNDTQKRQIINVAAGNKDTDAVNVAQLKNVGVRVGADTNTATIGTNKVAADFLAYNGQLNIKGDNNRVTTVSENDANGKDANVNVKFDYDGLVKAKTGAAVTVDQKTDGNGKTYFEIDAAAASKTVVADGKNTTVTGAGTTASPYKVNVEGALTGISSITNNGGGKIEFTTGGTTISGGPVNVSNNKITGVAKGDVNATSTDAVNGSQLYAVKAAERHIAPTTTGHEYTVDSNGDVTMTYRDGNDNAVTGEQAVIKGIAKQDLSNINDAGKKVITGLGTIVKAGDNVNVSESSDATTGQKTYTVNAVTPAVYTKADGTKVYKRPDGTFTTNSNLAAGNNVDKGDVITSFMDGNGNTTGGNMVINNVGSAIKNAGSAGDSFLTKLDAANTATPNAAVNVSDLKNTADGLTDKGLKFNANEGGVKTNKLGSTVTVQGSGALTAGKAYADEYNTANIRTKIDQGTDGNTTINVGLAKELKDINSISNGNSSITLNSNPGGTNNTPAVQITGGNLSMGNGTTNNKIVNLAPGTNDTDAVNYSQIKGLRTEVKQGANVTVSKTQGTDGHDIYTISAAATGGTASSWNIKSSADTANGGATATGHNANAVNISDQKTVEMVAGKNLTVKQDTTTDGAKVEFALSDNIVAGKDGANGKDGSVGATGKDGSSVVINGADGSIGMTGPKGQDGKDGINGRDGANISMTSAKGEQVLVNRDPAHSADTDKAERIVYVPKDASGNPIQGADGKNIVREVATMDDGLKFAGDDAQGTDKSKVIAKKLNNTVDIIGGADKDKLTNNNIGVNNDNGKLKVQLAKTIDLTKDGSVTTGNTKVDNSGVTITAPTGGATTNVTLTQSGLDNGGNKIVNVKAGDVNATSTDAVNGSQLYAVKAAERHIAPTTATHPAYTVDSNGTVTMDYVDGDGNATSEKALITGVAKNDLSNITNEGKKVITGLSSKVEAGDNVRVDVATDPTTNQKTYTVNAITPAVYTDKAGNKLTKDKDGKFHKPDGTEVAPADVITSIQDAAGNVTGGNSIVNNVGSAIKNAGNAGDSFLTKLDAANTATPNAAVNVSDLKNTADGLTDKGLKFTGNNTGTENAHKLGSLVKVQGEGVTATDVPSFASAAGNIAVVADGTDTLEIKLNKNLKGINSVSNGSSSITLNSNPGGTNNTPAVSITGGNVDVGGNNITNLKSGGDTDSNAANIGDVKKIASDTDTHIKPGTYTVAADKTVTMTYVNGKGETVKANGQDVVAKIDLSGLPTGGTSSTEKVKKAANGTNDTNIAEVNPQTGDTYGAADATYEVSVSRNAVKDAAREAVTVNNGGTTTSGTYTADPNNPISVTATPDNTNHNTTYAVTFDGDKAAKQIPLTYKATNGTTTSAAQTVKLDKGLNFTGGDYTTASVGADGKVTFDVNLGTTPTVTDGKPGVPGQAGASGKDGIATVKTVVDTINNSGWKANAKANGGSLDGNSTATVVKPGNTVNYAAGKNLIIKQELETDASNALTGNQTYTYSLNKDIDLTNAGSLTVGDTTVNNGGITIKAPTPAAGTTPTTTDVKLTNTGLDNGGNKIVNVKDGDVSATSTDAVNGSQLHAVKAAERHIKPDTYAVDANGKVTMKYVDGDNQDVAGEAVITGIAKQDLSNITNDGKKEITKLGTIVKAGDNVTVTSTSDGTTGRTTYTVNAVTPAIYTDKNGNKVVKRPDGTYTTNLDGSAGNDVAANDVIVSFKDAAGNTTGGNSIINNVGSAIKNQTPTMPAGQTATYLDKLKAAADDTKTQNAAVNVSDLHNTANALKDSELHIAPTAVKSGSTEAKGGTASGNTIPGAATQAYKYNATTKQVELTFNDGNGNAVADTKAVIDLSNLPTGGDMSSFHVTSSAESTTVGTHAGDTTQEIKDGKSIDFQAGKNMTVKQTNDSNGNTTINYALDKDLDVESVHVGKDGKDGKIGIDGKDGVDGLNGTNRVDIHVEKGAKGVDGTDGHDGVNGHNGKDGMTRIVYEDKGGKQEVATLNDGLKFTGNNESTVNNNKLNTLVKVQGEGTKEGTNAAGAKEIQTSDGTKFESAKDNIAVVADGTDTLTVKLNKNLKGLDSVQTKTVVLGNPDVTNGTTNITYNPTDKRIEYVTPDAAGTGTTTNKVANLDDEKHIKAGSYAVQNDGSVTMTYVDGNNKDVPNDKAIITGIAKQNLSNIDNAGKTVITGLGTIVKAGDNVTVSEAADATTGQKTYTVNAVTPAIYTDKNGNKVVKRPDGTYTTNLDGSAGNDVAGNDVIVSFKDAAGNTTGGNSIINNVGSAIKNQTPTMPAGQTATYLDKLKAAADDTKTQNAAVNVSDLHNTANALKDSELHIAPTAVKSGSTEVKGGTLNAAGTENVYKYDAATKKVTLTYNDGNGKAVADTKAVIDLSELAGSIQNYGFKTNADGNLKDGTTATATAVASGTTVTYAAGKNLTVEQEIAANGNQTYTYALNKDLTNLDKVVVNGKDGQPGKDGVTIIGPQGATGTPGTNGIDGKVGISGKDGKDAVSISGKDGVGHIGLTGPQGPQGPAGTPGTPGANIDISTDHGTQTLVKPEANNDNKSERIVYVPKDKDGNPLKDTDGNVIKREVATMDDGLKFAGDDGSVIKKALGTQLDIIGGADSTKLTDNNIGVNNDGHGKLKVQLAKNIDLTKDGSVTMGNTVVNNDGITITKPATATDPAKTVSLTGDGLNNGGNKITNVAAGTANTDAVNVQQLNDKVTTVKSSDNTISVKDTNLDKAGNVIDKTKGHQYDITINNQSVVEHAQTPVVYTDKDGNKLYKIVDPTTNTVTFNTKEDGTGTTVQPGDVIASMNNGGDSTTTPMKLNNVGSSIQKPNSTDTFLKQLDDANKNTPNGAVNVSDLKKTSDALIDKGLVFDANNKDPKTNKLGSKVTIAGTGALANGENFADKYDTKNIRTNITQDGDGNTTVEIGLNKNLKGLESVSVPGKDGVDGRDGVSITGKDGANGIDGKVGIGKDGKDAVSISGKDGIGHIGLTGSAGKDGKNATADITVKEGKAGVDGKDGITRIVYNDKDGNEHQVATHDDGLKFTGNNESTENKHKLNSVVKVQGEGVTENATSGKLEVNGQEFKSAAGNIAVVADGDKTLTVKMNKDLNLTKDGSLTIGDTKVNNDGITIKASTTPGTTDVKLTNQGLDNGGNKITNVAAGTANTDAVNVKQLNDKVTTVTSSDSSIKVVEKNDPTSTTYDATKGHQYDITINSQGVVNNAQTPVVYTKEDGTKVYLVDGKFYDNPQGNGAEVPKAQVIASMNNADGSTNTPMKLNNVGSSIANETGATFLAKLDSAKTNTPNGAVNVTDLKSTADAIGEKGLNFGAQSGNDIHKNLGEKLEIVGGGTKTDDKYDASNIKTMTKDGKVVIALDKDLKADSVTVGEKGAPGKDGVDGKIGVNGKDGSAVVINGKDGSIGLNGKDGANGITIKGDKGVDGVDGLNGTNGITRIVYQDKDGNNHEVATHDDGMKFAGDDGQTNQDTNPQVIKKHLNKVVDIVGGADKTKLTDNNIGVNNDGGKLRVQLANELSGITKISNGGSSISIADVPAGATSPAVTISGGNLSMGDGTHNNKIVNLAAGTNDTDAVNYKQLKDSRTTVTSQDGSVTITPTPNGDSMNYDLKVNPPLDPRVDQLAEEIGRVGAQGAALSALKPIQYDPLEPTQIMAGYGNYRGNSAIAMGVAHYKNESTLIHGGISWAGGSSHMMANAGVTWKVGNRDSEAAVADRYRKGPISSAYAMQQEMAAMKAQNAGLKGEVSDLKAENEQMKAQIAAMMAKLGL